jgi:hypothetical protein
MASTALGDRGARASSGLRPIAAGRLAKADRWRDNGDDRRQGLFAARFASPAPPEIHMVREILLAAARAGDDETLGFLLDRSAAANEADARRVSRLDATDAVAAALEAGRRGSVALLAPASYFAVIGSFSKADSQEASAAIGRALAVAQASDPEALAFLVDALGERKPEAQPQAAAADASVQDGERQTERASDAAPRQSSVEQKPEHGAFGLFRGARARAAAHARRPAASREPMDASFRPLGHSAPRNEPIELGMTEGFGAQNTLDDPSLDDSWGVGQGPTEHLAQPAPLASPMAAATPTESVAPAELMGPPQMTRENLLERFRRQRAADSAPSVPAPGPTPAL